MRIREVAQSPNHRTFTAKTEYTHYRKTIPDNHRIVGRDKYNKMIIDYFSSIADLTVGYIGGVCVKGLMYSFMFKLPKKVKYKVNGKQIFNFHSNHYVYAVAVKFASKYSHWGIKKKTFPADYRQKLMENIKSGVKYKAFFYSLQQAKFI